MPNKSYNRVLDEHLLALIAQGNHDALRQLEKRYHKHSLHLARELLVKYPETGITKRELAAVCDEHLSFLIAKYNPLLFNSFLTFWRRSVENVAVSYIKENSYNCGAMLFRGVISFDETNNNELSYAERIAEKDDNKLVEKRTAEVKELVQHHKGLFTNEEFNLIILVLEGYSFKELEHNGMMSRTVLYLTFKSASKKVRNLVKHREENTQAYINKH